MNDTRFLTGQMQNNNFKEARLISHRSHQSNEVQKNTLSEYSQLKAENDRAEVLLQQLKANNERLRMQGDALSARGKDIVEGVHGPRWNEGSESIEPPALIEQNPHFHDEAKEYVKAGIRESAYSTLPYHAAARAQLKASNRGYTPSARFSSSYGGGIEDIEARNSAKGARKRPIRESSQNGGKNRYTGQEYSKRELEKVRDLKHWRRHGSAMSRLTLGKYAARELDVDWGKAPIRDNDISLSEHQARLEGRGSIRTGYQSNTYTYMENPYLKRMGFDKKGNAIDRQKHFRNFLRQKQGIPIVERGEKGSIEDYWQEVNADKLQNDFLDLRGDPKYEEMMRMYERRKRFGFDDNNRYYVNELEKLRQLRQQEKQLNEDVPLSQVQYTHTIETGGHLGNAFVRIQLLDKVDPTTNKPREIILKDIRSNRVGIPEVFDKNKDIGLSAEAGIRYQLKRWNPKADAKSMNSWGNIRGVDVGFTKPGRYRLLYRQRNEKERAVTIIVDEKGGHAFDSEFAHDQDAIKKQAKPKSAPKNPTSPPPQRKEGTGEPRSYIV